MGDILIEFLESVLTRNVVIVSLLGVTLVTVEARGISRCIRSGLKYALVIALTSFFGWIVQSVLPAELDFFLAWVFLIFALIGIRILTSWGELRGEWLGLPRSMLVLGLLVGYPVLIWQQGLDFESAIIVSAGGAIGFYLAFVGSAALREQIELSEAHEILKYTPVLLFSLGVLSLGLVGFRFL